MNTKYGIIPEDILESYLNRLVSKIFKILPLKEEKCETLDAYIESLLTELIGNVDVLKGTKYDGDILSLVGTLSSLVSEDELSVYRQRVFKCIDIVKKIIQEKK